MSDLISRADAIGAVQDHFNADGFKGYDDGQKMMNRIKALPSAEGGDAEMNEVKSPYMKPSPNGADLISRADAVKAVRKELVCDGRHEAHDKTCRFIADVLLSALPSAEAVQEWIPCSERLPDVDVEVLATVDWSDVLIAWLKKDGTWETDEYILANDEILAWMPLPKPYKGGDTE